MSGAGHIRHVKRIDIDDAKWDRCIDSSPNGLVYAYTWYLDAMCDQWDALVLDDYAAVMPIPWRRKWGIKYVYTPAFVQQLGLVGNNNLQLLQRFISQLHRCSRYGDFHLNFDNPLAGADKRTNYVLSLRQPYSVLKKGYHQHLQRNLSKANRNTLLYQASDDHHLAINIFRSLFREDLPGTSASDFQKLSRLCAAHRKQWCMRIVSDKAGQILATVLMMQAKERYYLLLPAVTPEGRTLSAGHFLIDQFIQEHAGTPSILDFEGSDLPGVQRFYASFGGTNVPYFYHHWNRLPVPIRWLKK